MARDYATIHPDVCISRALASCGPMAGILFLQGFTQCDAYGRMISEVERLADKVVPAWIRAGHITEDDLPELRQALVDRGLWHQYEVAGREYIQYVHFDDYQVPSWLEKRGLRGALPDPPDRPELWVCNRVRRPGKADLGADDEPTPPTTRRRAAPAEALPESPPPQEAREVLPMAGGQMDVPPAEPSGSARVQAPTDPEKQALLSEINRGHPQWVLAGEKFREFLELGEKVGWQIARLALDETHAAEGDLRYLLKVLGNWHEAGVTDGVSLAAYRKRRKPRERDSPRKESNVFLKPESKAADHWDHVYKPFGET